MFFGVPRGVSYEANQGRLRSLGGLMSADKKCFNTLNIGYQKHKESVEMVTVINKRETAFVCRLSSSALPVKA